MKASEANGQGCKVEGVSWKDGTWSDSEMHKFDSMKNLQLLASPPLPYSDIDFQDGGMEAQRG